jgi:hypothetical protein
VHLLMLACLRGIAVRGPMVGGEHAYALVRDWLGPAPEAAPAVAGRDVALAELARRFLLGHAPASDRDLAKWSGLPLRDVRRGLSAIASDLADRDDGLAELAAPRRAGRRRRLEVPPPRLLGAYDPVLHGWVSREPILRGHGGVVTSNGLFRPFALVDGQAVATWRLPGGVVTLDRFAELPGDVDDALAADGADVRRFLGLT